MNSNKKKLLKQIQQCYKNIDTKSTNIKTIFMLKVVNYNIKEGSQKNANTWYNNERYR